ncbi:MAG: DUF418 domain-containing protein [Candidatus Binatia bacterium]
MTNTSAAVTLKPVIEPIDPGQRLEAVDMVRGFALLGVLLVNMYNFGAAWPIWTAPIDQLAFSVMRFFFETKSWRLFSMLFAFGFSLQLLRAEQREVRFLPVYLRRLTILFLMGMGHALFYNGDILMYYAELGLILVAFRKLPPRVLLILAMVLLMVFPVGRAVSTLTREPEIKASTPELDLEKALEKIEEKRRTHPYSVGSIREVWAVNADSIPPNPLDYPLDAESSFAFFAMFLLGLYVGRRRILHDIQKHRVLIQRVCGWGLGFGVFAMTCERILHLTTGYEVFDEHQATALAQFAGDLLFAFGSTALSLGYAAAITLLSQCKSWRRIISPLGAVGRLALTVYLTQTLMFTTLFYGYGFGQVFRIGPAAVTAYAVLFFTIQIAACAWWVRHFRFGPMEWLWRSLTYRKLQPMRMRTKEVYSSGEENNSGLVEEKPEKKDREPKP